MAETVDGSHVQWRLKNGAVPFDLRKVRKCGAQAKRTGQPCRAPAMANGRCRLHGGKCRGPVTPEGLERSRKANWKHGFYSKESIAEKRRVKNLLKKTKELLRRFESESV